MKKKNLIVLLLISLGLAYAMYYVPNIVNKSVVTQHEPITQQQAAKTVKPDEIFLAQLKQEEANVWKELEKIGITKEKYEKAYHDYLPVYQRSDIPFSRKRTSPETVSLITSILQEHGLNPKNISIYGYNDLSPAAASDRVIYVNESVFNKHSKEAKRFIITHEIQHILHGDNCNRYIMERIYGKDTETLVKDKTHPLLQLSRFKEMRADIKTALENKTMAQAYYAFAKEGLEKRGDTPGATHPKNSDRLKLAERIIQAYDSTAVSVQCA
jgi:Zn-dependent protease with chaperone function